MKPLMILAALMATPVFASDGGFVPGQLALIRVQVDSNTSQIASNTAAIQKLEDQLFARLDKWVDDHGTEPAADKIPTPPMPVRLVSTPVRNVAAATAAVVTAPVRMVRRKVCQNGRCSYVMVPETVTAAPVVVTAAPVPVIRSVQRAGCSGGSCSRTVYRRGLFGRWR